jgi:cysteinyl-tRNA synthetase
MENKLYLYNTATRQKEQFVPQWDVVGMYCCGPTVYNFAHIGNLRTYVFEDVLKRTLVALGYKVKHVVNITDVGHLTSDSDSGDDKMEKGASREGKTVWQIADAYTAAFKKDIKDLNILDPDIWPKATDHIADMIAMVASLKDKGFTYKTHDGVYFDTSKFPRYAEFAKIDIENLQAGSRVDMGDKKNVTDFALWKFSPKGSRRQMEWDSPWGKGFPGWHIECSAMSLKYLDQPLDIHCGGQDHVRVHHTNEIAQAEAATGKQFAKFWLHGEFLVQDKGKMAKSAGDFLTLETVTNEGVSPIAYRMFCYTAHYRSPLMFSWEAVRSAAAGLANLKKLIVSEVKKPGDDATPPGGAVAKLLEPFFTAVCDDMNMTVAVSHIWSLVKDGGVTAEAKYAAIKAADTVLALDLLTDDRPEEIVTDVSEAGVNLKIVSQAALDQATVSRIAELMSRRRSARKDKAFDKADEIRKLLSAMNVTIKDLPGGVSECRVK